MDDTKYFVEIMLEKAVQIQNSDLDLSPSLNPNQILELIEIKLPITETTEIIKSKRNRILNAKLL